jgi:hypothetical protein
LARTAGKKVALVKVAKRTMRRAVLPEAARDGIERRSTRKGRAAFEVRRMLHCN